MCAVAHNWDGTVTTVSYKPGFYAIHRGHLSPSAKHPDPVPCGHRGASHLKMPLSHPLLLTDNEVNVPGLKQPPHCGPTVHSATTSEHLLCAPLCARCRHSNEPEEPPKAPPPPRKEDKPRDVEYGGHKETRTGSGAGTRGDWSGREGLLATGVLGEERSPWKERPMPSPGGRNTRCVFEKQGGGQ